MRKIAALFLMLLFIAAAFGCGEDNGTQGTVSDESVQPAVYRISYELGGAEPLFFLKPVEATEGEKVAIRTYVLYDADIHILIDGEEIEKSYGSDTSDGKYWEFSFTMPGRDVTVTARPYTKEEIWGVGT